MPKSAGAETADTERLVNKDGTGETGLLTDFTLTLPPAQPELQDGKEKGKATGQNGRGLRAPWHS